MGFLHFIGLSTWCALMAIAIKPIIDWICFRPTPPKKQPRWRVIRPRPLVIVSVYD